MFQQNYQVLSILELKELLNSDEISLKKFDSQLSTNNAYVYYLSSGKVILLPNIYTNKSQGLLLQNKETLKNLINKDSFPIENENKTVEEKYKNDIESLGSNISNLIHSMMLKNGLSDYKPDHEISTLSLLLKQLKQKRKKLSEKELFNAALALGEYTREVNGGKWIILKKYGTFNPYYTPAIIYPNQAILLFWDFLQSYFDDSNTTPEIFAALPYIKKPGLTLDGHFFNNNFYGYKIFDDNTEK